MQCLPFTRISDINVKSIGHSSTFSGNITLSYQADPLAFWRMRLSQCTQQICFLIRGLSGQHFKIWASRYTRRHLISSFVTNFVKIGPVVEAGQRSKEILASKNPLPFESCPLPSLTLKPISTVLM